MEKRKRATARFKLAMSIFSAVYLLGAMLFFFMSPYFSSVFGVPREASHFWVILSVSMMTMLAYVSWQSSLNPSDARFVHVHLISKWVSTSGFLLSYIFIDRLPAYLMAAGIDFGVIMIISVLRARSYDYGK